MGEEATTARSDADDASSSAHAMARPNSQYEVRVKSIP